MNDYYLYKFAATQPYEWTSSNMGQAGTVPPSVPAIRQQTGMTVPYGQGGRNPYTGMVIDAELVNSSHVNKASRGLGNINWRKAGRWGLGAAALAGIGAAGYYGPRQFDRQHLWESGETGRANAENSLGRKFRDRRDARRAERGAAAAGGASGGAVAAGGIGPGSSPMGGGLPPAAPGAPGSSPTGTVAYPDGPMSMPGGGTWYPEGPMSMPRGTSPVSVPGGPMSMPGGGTGYPDGPMSMPPAVAPAARRQPDSNLFQPDNRYITPDNRAITGGRLGRNAHLQGMGDALNNPSVQPMSLDQWTRRRAGRSWDPAAIERRYYRSPEYFATRLNDYPQ